MQLRIQDWPHMKRNQRDEYHKQIYRLAYPAAFRDENDSLSIEQLAKLQNGGVL